MSERSRFRLRRRRPARERKEGGADVEREQERARAVHVQDQLEAKLADAEARATAAELAAKASRQSSVPAAETSTAPPKRRFASIVDKPIPCPKCEHPYRNLTLMRRHLEWEHKFDRAKAEQAVQDMIAPLMKK